MAAPRKPKLAVWKFASCDGCQLTLARLRGRAARGRRRGRDRQLRRGDPRRRQGALRPVAGRGVDHHGARCRANPRGSPPVEGAGHHRRLRHRRRHPGAPELRRCRGLHLHRLRPSRLHLDARHIDPDCRACAGRFRAPRLPDRQAPARRGALGLPRRPEAGDPGPQRLRRVQAQGQCLRHRCPRHALPRAGHPCRLRRAVPELRSRLLRLLRPDGDAECRRLVA